MIELEIQPSAYPEGIQMEQPDIAFNAVPCTNGVEGASSASTALVGSNAGGARSRYADVLREPTASLMDSRETRPDVSHLAILGYD
jgi:hypothetical protein